MGSEHSTRTRLIARCCQGASFGFGFVFTVLTLMTMFWIAWCYFGLTIVQISDTQRRALVNYSYPSAKPSPTPTSSPARATTAATDETSINSISKSPTTPTILRGSSRGEMPSKVEKKKEPEVVSSFAKGDFASRDRSTQSVSDSRGSSTSAVSSPRGPPRPSDEIAAQTGHKAAILSGTSSEESEDDRIYARRVLPPGAENRPEDTTESDKRRNAPDGQPESRPDISPTKVFDEVKTGNSRRPQEPEVGRTALEDGKTDRREFVNRDAAAPSRRDDSLRSDIDPVRKETDREYSRRYAPSADRERSRLDDDVYDDRGSRSKYDRRDRDRDRDFDDRYSKGDTRVYPEDRTRERVRERYPDDAPRRGDDDRYRDYEDRERSRDRDYVKPREIIPDDRPLIREERYRDDDRYIRTKDDDRYVPRDDDRYRSRDERYRLRDDDRYRDEDRKRPLTEDRYRDNDRKRPLTEDRYRDEDRKIPLTEDRYRDEDRKIPLTEDRYRDRKDDRYRAKDDDRYVSRTDERVLPRDDDRYRSRDDDRYRSRSDERYRLRDEDDRYSTRGTFRDDDDDRYKSPTRTVDEKDRLRSIDDELYVESRARDNIRDTVSRSSDLPPAGRPSSTRIYESVRDYDVGGRGKGRDTLDPPRLSRPLPDDERYVETDRRPSRYDDDDRRISPTRTRIDDSISRSSIVDSRPKDTFDDARYTESERESSRRDNRYIDRDDRLRDTRIQDSRRAESSSNTRRIVDERDSYKTRAPYEGAERNENSREEVVLDRRSYSAEDEYRRQNPRSDIDDRSRRPAENTRRRYEDDEKYPTREPVSDGRKRDDYNYEKIQSRDRTGDAYDRPPVARDDPPLPLRKYADEDERKRIRDSDLSTVRKEEYDGRGRPRSEDRYYDRDDYTVSRPSSRRTFTDDNARDYKDSYDDDRRRPGSRQQSRPREPSIGSSMTTVYSREPDDVVTREKRFQASQNKQQSSRVTLTDAVDRERGYLDTGSESRSRDLVRPLSAKDVIEAAMRHPDTGSQNAKNVYYPVFDPRVTNLTSPEIIRPSERRGTTITAKKKRSVQIRRWLNLDP